MASLQLTGVTSELTKAQQFLEQWWAENQLSEVERFPFDLALEELFVNVASYGHDETGAPCRVEVTLTRSDDTGDGIPHTTLVIVRLAIRDDGPAFDPVATKTPDLHGSVRARAIGGLGIHLTRSVMDTIDYEYKDGHNQVSVEKQINR